VIRLTSSHSCKFNLLIFHIKSSLRASLGAATPIGNCTEKTFFLFSAALRTWMLQYQMYVNYASRWGYIMNKTAWFIFCSDVLFYSIAKLLLQSVAFEIVHFYRW
jgi:hypothetical protein